MTDLNVDAVKALVRQAQKLGLTWQLQFANVTRAADVNAPNVVSVACDGDDTSILATSLAGDVQIGDRVAVITVPPSGVYVIGVQTSTWHALTLTAPWANRGAGYPVLSYKKLSAPASAVWIVGVLTVNGATNGSTITTLPESDLFPLTAVGSPAGNDGIANEVLIEVDTVGVIRAFCTGFGTHIQINMIVPLDL